MNQSKTDTNFNLEPRKEHIWTLVGFNTKAKEGRPGGLLNATSSFAKSNFYKIK